MKTTVEYDQTDIINLLCKKHDVRPDQVQMHVHQIPVGYADDGELRTWVTFTVTKDDT